LRVLLHAYNCRATFLFVTDPATPAIYPLSLHDALPICEVVGQHAVEPWARGEVGDDRPDPQRLAGDSDRDAGGASEQIGGIVLEDRKSTRLNSSHVKISYAVFCLKKKTEKSPEGCIQGL